MKLQVQFAGYEPIPVDTEYASCAVFENLTATESARLLEEAVMGDEDDAGWTSGASPSGEAFQVRMDV